MTTSMTMTTMAMITTTITKGLDGGAGALKVPRRSPYGEKMGRDRTDRGPFPFPSLAPPHSAARLRDDGLSRTPLASHR
jgi:hypothetical protein